MRKLLLCAGILLANSALAVPVTWTIQDGGNLSGYFTYDADTPGTCNDYSGAWLCPQFGAYTDFHFSFVSPLSPSGGTLQLTEDNASVLYFYPYVAADIIATDQSRLFVDCDYGGCADPGDPYPNAHFEVQLSFDTPLTNAGGEIGLSGGINFYPDGAPGTWYSLDVSSEATVVANVVPIPAAVWLFGSALLGLGWLRRR